MPPAKNHCLIEVCPLFLFIQMSAADIKSEIRDLYITGAKQVR